MRRHPVAAGLALINEQAALVWHMHRRFEGTLERQLHDDGHGCHHIRGRYPAGGIIHELFDHTRYHSRSADAPLGVSARSVARAGRA